MSEIKLNRYVEVNKKELNLYKKSIPKQTQNLINKIVVNNEVYLCDTDSYYGYCAKNEMDSLLGTVAIKLDCLNIK